MSNINIKTNVNVKVPGAAGDPRLRTAMRKRKPAAPSPLTNPSITALGRRTAAEQKKHSL